MLGCFNPILGQKLTNPAIGLLFLNYVFNPMIEFVLICPIIGLKQPNDGSTPKSENLENGFSKRHST